VSISPPCIYTFLGIFGSRSCRAQYLCTRGGECSVITGKKDRDTPLFSFTILVAGGVYFRLSDIIKNLANTDLRRPLLSGKHVHQNWKLPYRAHIYDCRYASFLLWYLVRPIIILRNIRLNFTQVSDSFFR